MSQTINNEDFLALTRANEYYVRPFSFRLSNNTLVDVWDTGVIVFTPGSAKGAGRDIVLSCGVHGNETAPIEILNELIQAILRTELRVSDRTLFVFCNPPAINKGVRFVKENMNRLFSGAYADGDVENEERERTEKLEMYITRFFGQGGRLGVRERFHYDLHTAIRGSKHEKFAVYPCLHGRPWSKSQLNFLANCGVSAVLLYDRPATTFSYFSSSNFQAHAFTIELGKVQPFGKNDPQSFRKVHQALLDLVAGTRNTNKEDGFSSLAVFKMGKTINRMSKNFRFTFSDTVENFTEFPIGEVLGYDGDAPFVIEVEGEAIVFPNARVAQGQRAMLTVVPCQLLPNELAE